MTFDCAALVPAYNEAPRIKQVLAVLTQAKLFKKILVIDDGSNDGTSQIVQVNFPQVELLRLEKNQGKAAAVKAGLAEVKTEYVLLCDADLKGLQASELEAALACMTDCMTNCMTKNQPAPEMIILKRVNEVKHILQKIKKLLKVELIEPSFEFRPKTLEKMSCLLGGERLLKTTVLRSALTTTDTKQENQIKIEGYGLEVGLNQYCLDHELPTCWLPSQALGSFKIKELGVVAFVNKYLTMHFQLVQQLGVKKYLQQVNQFCQERCELYT